MPSNTGDDRSIPLAVWVVVALHFGVGACQKAPSDEPLSAPPLSYGPRSPGDGVVARVGRVAIFQSDVKRQAEATGASPREALDVLVTLEALAARAEARGLANDEPARLAMKQVMAQLYLQREFETGIGPNDIPRPVLQEVYGRMKDGFVHSRLVRVAMLDLYAFERQGPEQRSRARVWAQELTEELSRRSAHTPEAWRSLTQEPLWSERHLKLGVTWQTDDQPYSKTVGEAVQRLTAPGEMTPLIEDAAGFHVALYLGERSARHTPFEEAEDELRRSILGPWRQRHFMEMTDELGRQARVVVTPDPLVKTSLR